MKAIAMLVPTLFVASCAEQPAASLGDSPIREIRCPSFLDHTGCIKRAERECGSERVTVISAPPEDETLGQGTTVPIEGSIQHRTIIVRCEEE